jgi:hypothetical protein
LNLSVPLQFTNQLNSVGMFIGGILDHLLLISVAGFGIFYFADQINSLSKSTRIKADSPKLEKGFVVFCRFNWL